MFFSDVSYKTTVAKKTGGMAIFVAIFLAVRERREASSKRRGYFVVRGYFVAITSLAISRGYFRGYFQSIFEFAWLFSRGYFLCVAIF